MRILYFAWLRSKVGMAEETVTPPAAVTDVAGLLDWLEGRGPGHAEALARKEAIRVAVNQDFANPGDPVGPDDEVAIFPPVTGG